MSQKWHQLVAEWDAIAEAAQKLTDDGWHVHTIIPTTDCGPRHRDGVIAWRDEPDVSGGVPR